MIDSFRAVRHRRTMRCVGAVGEMNDSACLGRLAVISGAQHGLNDKSTTDLDGAAWKNLQSICPAADPPVERIPAGNVRSIKEMLQILPPIALETNAVGT